MGKEIAAAEVRLVRCPNCGLILPEIANIPLYRCGGCHTTLQAKRHSGANVPSNVRSEINETKAAHLQSKDAQDDCIASSVPIEQSGRLCFSDPSTLKPENGNAQHVEAGRDEPQSQPETNEKWATQSSFSDDTGQSAYGDHYHVQVQDKAGSEEHSLGAEEELDSVQSSSSELSLYERKKRLPTAPSNGDRCVMSNAQNPLYDSHFGSREQSSKVEEASDGSSDRLYNPRSSRQNSGVGSSLDLSGELIHSSHCQGPQPPTQSQMISQQFSNPKLSNWVSNDSDGLQNNVTGYLEQSWKSRHHSPVGCCGENEGERSVNSAGFEQSFVGIVPEKEQFFSRKIHDFSKNYDYHHLNQTELEAAQVMDRTKPYQSELQFQTSEKSIDSSMDRTQSTLSELQFQTREKKMDLLTDQKKMSQFDLQSQKRERSLDMLMDQRKSTQFNSQSRMYERNLDLLTDGTKPSQFELQSQTRERNLNFLQDPYSFQPSQHGQQRRQMEAAGASGVREIAPRLSRNMLPESESSDFYTYSDEVLSQSKDVGYDYGEFYYSENLSGMNETELLKQERIELLRKLDDLRDRLTKSELSGAPMKKGCQKIRRSVVASESRQMAIEKQPCQMGHGAVFLAPDNGEEVLPLGDFSLGPKENSGQLAHVEWTQCGPQEDWRRLHMKPVSDSDVISRHPHSAMDSEDTEMSNELASKHICTRNLGPYKSRLNPYGLYANKSTIPPSQSVSQMSFSREQGIKDRHQIRYAPCQSMEMNHNSYNCCSRHSLRHPESFCSHFHYERQQPLHMPLQVPTTTCYHPQMCSAASNHICSHHFYPSHAGVQASSVHHLPRNSDHEVSHGQRSMTQDSGLIICQEKKHSKIAVAPKQRIFTCPPFAGGAPFVLCDNCLQLLLIPANLPPARKKTYKLRCGSCLNMFVLTIHDKKNSITMSKCIEYPAKYVQKNPHDSAELGFSAAHSSNTVQSVDANQIYANGTQHSHVDDHKTSISESHSADGEPGIKRTSPSLEHSDIKSCTIFDKPNLGRHGLKSYLVGSKHHFLMGREDERPQACTVQSMRGQNHYTTRSEGLHFLRDDSNSGERFPEANLGSSLAGSPLHELFGYSSPSQMIKKFLPEKTSVGNFRKSLSSGKSNYSEMSSDWDCLKVPRKPTIVGSSHHEHLRLETSTEFSENEHEDDLSKDAGRSWNTSFTGFLKKSIRDLKKGNQGSEVRPKISVNGRFIPDSLIKKAEVYAGHIRPGHYWYDFRAGFWGVMGERCLGIIPPSIEEFNYPMPRDCAGGKTQILVNGRELHQKDLELLAGRGLPTTKDKAYIIEISGRVVDEASGTELKSLGKLAPTLERIGRGVGMHVPKKRS